MVELLEHQVVVNESLRLDLKDGIQVFVKREDRIHEEVSGNKYRKLKYNFEEATKLGYNSVLTFGGAYSNHIAATAAAGRLLGIHTVGIIRGEELEHKYHENPTLLKASQDGMQLEFVTRSDYRKRHETEFLKMLSSQYPDCYFIPEGGTNALAVKGCEEILTGDDFMFDVICCAVGTGGTLAGLINSAQPHQHLIGFPALKGDFLEADIRKFVSSKCSWELILDYHFGGYGKMTPELLAFIKKIKADSRIVLDPVYTSKMMYGILDLISKDFFAKGTKILAIHTGGLQGWNQNIKDKGKL